MAQRYKSMDEFEADFYNEKALQSFDTAKERQMTSATDETEEASHTSPD